MLVTPLFLKWYKSFFSIPATTSYYSELKDTQVKYLFKCTIYLNEKLELRGYSFNKDKFFYTSSYYELRSSLGSYIYSHYTALLNRFVNDSMMDSLTTVSKLPSIAYQDKKFTQTLVTTIKLHISCEFTVTTSLPFPPNQVNYD